MTIIEKIAYNKASASKSGWTPSDFGGTDFNEDLINKIIQLQKSLNITADGLVGATTYRMLSAAIHSEEDSYIICGGKRVNIDWPKVVVMGEQGCLTAPQSAVRKRGSKKPSMFVVHWDACLNSAACASVLVQRGLSVHFCLDNDGTIYQLVDCNDVAFHASGANSVSIGVEVSNAFYMKYQDWYEKKGFGKRPIVGKTKCNGGTVEEHLGFYPVQEEALKVLIQTVCNHYGIPLVVPTDSAGVMENKQVASVVDNSFHGVVCHYHITKEKIDCAGLKLDELVKPKV